MDPEEELGDAHEDDLDPGSEAPEGDDDLLDEGPEDELPEEDLDEEDGAAAPVEAQTRQPTRGESRQQRLASENARLRAEIEEIRRGSQSQEQRQRAEDFRRQEQERLENMSPEERVEYRVNQRMANVEFRVVDSTDRTEFNDLAREQPAVAAIKDEVEALYQERARNGQWVDRKTIATFLIGQKALAKAPRARAAGRRAEQVGRERNAVRPPASRSDAAPSGRRMNEQEARRKRLEDVQL